MSCIFCFLGSDWGCWGGVWSLILGFWEGFGEFGVFLGRFEELWGGVKSPQDEILEALGPRLGELWEAKMEPNRHFFAYFSFFLGSSISA